MGDPPRATQEGWLTSSSRPSTAASSPSPPLCPQWTEHGEWAAGPLEDADLLTLHSSPETQWHQHKVPSREPACFQWLNSCLLNTQQHGISPDRSWLMKYWVSIVPSLDCALLPPSFDRCYKPATATSNPFFYLYISCVCIINYYLIYGTHNKKSCFSRALQLLLRQPVCMHQSLAPALTHFCQVVLHQAVRSKCWHSHCNHECDML